MAFSDVTFAFKQVITSAKLNQLQENVRTHDHISVGQGDKFGRVGGAGSGTNVSSTTTAVVNLIGASVTIPTGVTPARRLQYTTFLRLRQDSGGAGNVRADIYEGTTVAYDLASFPIPSTGVIYSFSHVAIRPVPPAGTHTFSLRLNNIGTGGWTAFSYAIDAIIV